jgi:sec-independent protein translocase protein TatA
VFTDILQPTHLIFVLVVALLVLGPKRLPEVGRSLGRGLRDFRSAISGEDHDEVPTASPMNLASAEPAHQPAPARPAEPAVDEPAVEHAEATQADTAEQPEHVA